MTDARTGLAERAAAGIATEEGPKPPSVAMMIHDQRHEIERALPMHLKGSAEAFERAAVTLVRTNASLAKCEPRSILGGLMVASQLGLQLGGPLGHAYLVPFKGKAQFILGYKGAIDLAWRSGKLKSLSVRTVYEADEFEFEYGLDERCHHVPMLNGDPGPAVLYYGVAKFITGGHHLVVAGKAEINRHKAKSATGSRSDSPWATDYDAMARKTVVNIMKPYLPLTSEVLRDMAQDGVVAEGTSIDDLTTDTVDWGDDGDVVDGEVVE
jgi:recombination protein RecT